MIFYVRKLGKEGAKYGLSLWNKTVKTSHNVSQFWTYDEKKFLAQRFIRATTADQAITLQAGTAGAMPAVRRGTSAETNSYVVLAAADGQQRYLWWPVVPAVGGILASSSDCDAYS